MALYSINCVNNHIRAIYIIILICFFLWSFILDCQKGKNSVDKEINPDRGIMKTIGKKPQI